MGAGAGDWFIGGCGLMAGASIRIECYGFGVRKVSIGICLARGRVPGLLVAAGTSFTLNSRTIWENAIRLAAWLRGNQPSAPASATESPCGKPRAVLYALLGRF